LPLQPAPKLFWTSRDGARALVWRTAGPPPYPSGPGVLHLDVLELVDPVAHRVIARDESCMGYFGLGDLYVDADERALVVGMQEDTAEPWAVVDIGRGRFAVIREGAPAQQDGRPCVDFHASSAWELGRLSHGVVSADLTSWRTRVAVVALDTGRVTAQVAGDYPGDDAAIEYVIDARTSVVVAPAWSGQVCAGVLHRSPATDGSPRLAPSPANGPPRCVPASPR
jgi:hypothetical protein